MYMYEHLIIGLQGTAVSSEERRRLREKPPLGVILFERNIEAPEQVKRLLADVRECTGKHTWAAIDEEGGRVSRIPWPPFNSRKNASGYGVEYALSPEAASRAVYDDSHRIGLVLSDLGFTHNCAPVLDVFHAQGHRIIGERAYSADINVVTELGTACIRGLHDAGIEAVAKHFPGNGRANADSHVAVPEVDAPMDTLLAEAQPFARLGGQGLGHIMTAHVVYKQVEQQVATLSPFWLKDVLRTRFGFDGCIWSDDLCMKGAGNDICTAARQALDAGCDALLVCQPGGISQIYDMV